MKIKTKLYFIIIIFSTSILSYLGLFYFNYTINEAMNEYDKVKDTLRYLTEKSNRLEDEFLLHMDMKYAEDFDDTVNEIREIIEILAEETKASKHKNLLRKVINDYDEYRNTFLKVIDLYHQRGMHEDTGLRGKLRSSVHNVESYLVDYKDFEMQKQMLLLRRREKDYLIRLDLRYID